jgi:hypothetical protein
LELTRRGSVRSWRLGGVAGNGGGPITVVADGSTNNIDILVARNGTLYVINKAIFPGCELVKNKA